MSPCTIEIIRLHGAFHLIKTHISITNMYTHVDKKNSYGLLFCCVYPLEMSLVMQPTPTNNALPQCTPQYKWTVHDLTAIIYVRFCVVLSYRIIIPQGTICIYSCQVFWLSYPTFFLPTQYPLFSSLLFTFHSRFETRALI